MASSRPWSGCWTESRFAIYPCISHSASLATWCPSPSQQERSPSSVSDAHPWPTLLAPIHRVSVRLRGFLRDFLGLHAGSKPSQLAQRQLPRHLARGSRCLAALLRWEQCELLPVWTPVGLGDT